MSPSGCLSDAINLRVERFVSHPTSYICTVAVHAHSFDLAVAASILLLRIQNLFPVTEYRMPARNSSMELSSPSNPDVETGLRPSRRKSGRATKQTEVLDPSDGMGSKRKHNSLSGTSAAESEEDNDDEPDEEELRERNRKARKTAPKRAIVKNKTLNGSMPVRPAPSRAKKTKRAAGFAGAQDVGGLYGRIRIAGISISHVAHYSQASYLATASMLTRLLPIGVEDSTLTKQMP